MFKLIKNLNYIWNKFKGTNNEFWESLEEELILNNVSVETTNLILQDIKECCLKNNINNFEEIKKLLKEKIKNILISDRIQTIQNQDIIEINTKPFIILVAGVNGVGKTSSIAKLAYLFQKKGKSVLISAADTFRAAAIEQIQFYGEKLGIEVIKHQRNSDPGAVVFDSLDSAIAKNIDIVIIDTAGRMQTSVNLIDELKKIKRIINKKIGRDPDEVLLVIDSNTGQNAKSQAEIFNKALNITGIILTKADSTSRGGVVLSIKNDLNIPIKFITFGEKIEDINYFDPEKFADLLID
ncbi:MAG: signal recognition particle-docking protein FtsY [Cyanobacteria bacterium]|nr:signal recognition particle-docking protein FtsY [Cyanobacteriota bacterium]